MPQSTPMNPENWRGRAEIDSQRFFQIVHNDAQRNSDFAIVGYACDEGVRRNLGRVGAALGPDAIRKQLARLPVHLAMSVLDVGNIIGADGDMESAQQSLAHKVKESLGRGQFPIVLGGGHDLSFGHFMGIQSQFPNKTIGVINFDAHLDIRSLINNQGHSGSSFEQIAQFVKQGNNSFRYLCIGMQDFANHSGMITHAQNSGAQIIRRECISSDESHRTVQEFMKSVDCVYLTICMDVLAQAYAPGVSAPQPNGLNPSELIRSLEPILKSSKIVSLDVAETNPLFDCDDQTSRCAAFVIASAMHVLKGIQS